MNLLQDNNHNSMYSRIGEILGALPIIRLDGSTTYPTGFQWWNSVTVRTMVRVTVQLQWIFMFHCAQISEQGIAEFSGRYVVIWTNPSIVIRDAPTVAAERILFASGRFFRMNNRMRDDDQSPKYRGKFHDAKADKVKWQRKADEHKECGVKELCRISCLH